MAVGTKKDDFLSGIFGNLMGMGGKGPIDGEDNIIGAFGQLIRALIMMFQGISDETDPAFAPVRASTNNLKLATLFKTYTAKDMMESAPDSVKKEVGELRKDATKILNNEGLTDEQKEARIMVLFSEFINTLNNGVEGSEEIVDMINEELLNVVCEDLFKNGNIGADGNESADKRKIEAFLERRVGAGNIRSAAQQIYNALSAIKKATKDETPVRKAQADLFEKLGKVTGAYAGYEAVAEGATAIEKKVREAESARTVVGAEYDRVNGELESADNAVAPLRTTLNIATEALREDKNNITRLAAVEHAKVALELKVEEREQLRKALSGLVKEKLAAESRVSRLEKDLAEQNATADDRRTDATTVRDSAGVKLTEMLKGFGGKVAKEAEKERTKVADELKKECARHLRDVEITVRLMSDGPSKDAASRIKGNKENGNGLYQHVRSINKGTKIKQARIHLEEIRKGVAEIQEYEKEARKVAAQQQGQRQNV